MDSNIKAFDVEGLEEDFRSLLSVFWWIERRFGLELKTLNMHSGYHEIAYAPIRSNDPLALPSGT